MIAIDDGLIRGTVAPRYEGVAAAFRANFAQRGEVGASFCVLQEGEVVVDLWGGVTDRETGQAWEADTLCTVFSVTKGLAAICLLMLADRGLLDHDAPVADYWEGFGQHGKRAITVRQLLNHRGGVSALDVPLTLDDFQHHPERVLGALESQVPLWEPGTDQGYHATSYGPYVAELFKRVAGVSIGQFFRSEVTEPLGADAFIGLPEGLEDRVATLYPLTLGDKLFRALPRAFLPRDRDGRMLRQALRKRSDTRRAVAVPADLGPSGLSNLNRPEVQRLELPWVNGIASARGLARTYAPLANGGEALGVRLVESPILAEVIRRGSWTTRDRTVQKPLGFSLGFVKEEVGLFSPHEQSFGHPGAGGSMGWADPVARLSWGYVTNRMSHRIRSPRGLALCRAVNEV